MNTNKDNSDIGLETNIAAPTLSPERKAREAAQLARVAAQLNADAGVTAPTHVAVAPALPPAAYERPRISPVPVVVGAVDRLVAEAKQHEQAAPKPAAINSARIFYTGRLKAGKDFVAAQTGATIVGFADPLYAIRKHFFGEVDKDRHGAREFLQTVGQWGRGEVSDKYPLTPARAAFTSMIRALGPRGEFGEFAVEWDRFGRDADIWLNSLLRRAGAETGAVAVTNVRFGNERTALKEAGWSGFHVMCSPQTLEQRIRAAGIPPNSAALTDASEQLAISLDAASLNVRDASRKVRVIWNDEKAGCPTTAFHTVASFLESLRHE